MTDAEIWAEIKSCEEKKEPQWETLAEYNKIYNPEIYEKIKKGEIKYDRNRVRRMAKKS